MARRVRDLSCATEARTSTWESLLTMAWTAASGWAAGHPGEALDLGALHQRVGQNGLCGAGFEHHLQLPEGSALEAPDPGLELLARHRLRLVGLYVRHQPRGSARLFGHRRDVVIHHGFEQDHGGGLDSVGIGDPVSLRVDHSCFGKVWKFL